MNERIVRRIVREELERLSKQQHINVNVRGLISEKRLVDLIHQGLLAKRRKSGSLGLG